MRNVNLAITTIVLFFLTGCNDDNDSKIVNQPNIVAGCDTSNTIFNQLYNDRLNNGLHTEDITMDTSVHSYTFEVNAPATICKVGYQSQPTFEAFPYIIEIYNNTTGTTAYSGSHTFSSTTLEYISITPVVLNVGDSYTIKRIQTNFPNDATIFIGRILRRSDSAAMVYPYNFGILTITSASFYLAPAPDNTCLPYIDIVFE